MYTYIVSWCLSIYVIVACPETKNVDQFGRKTMAEYAVCCREKILECGKEKVIYDKKDAYEFYGLAKGQHDIEMVKIDSIYTPFK